MLSNRLGKRNIEKDVERLLVEAVAAPSLSSIEYVYRLNADTAVSATTISLNRAIPGPGAYELFVVIDPFNTECEVRRVTAISGTTYTVAALAYAHDEDDVVLWTTDPTVNVKWFGALGDDSNDDTTAIQRAIDQATEEDHGRVIIPAGTYRISSSIVMDSRVSLIGENTLETILKATTAITMIKMEIGETSIQNLRLTGYDRTSSSSIAIKIGGNPSYNNVEAIIKDIRIYTGHYYGIYCTQECDHTLIDHVTAFDPITKAAIFIQHDGVTGGKSAGVIIQRCHLSLVEIIGGAINYGIYIQGVDSCKLEQNIVNNFDVCIFIFGSSSSGVWNLMMAGNHTEERRTGIHNGTDWSASASISQDDIIRPTKANATGFVYKAQDPGTTGGTEPTWPTTYGSTVVDNDITWEAHAQSISLELGAAYIRSVQIGSHFCDSQIFGIVSKTNARVDATSIYISEADFAFIHSAGQTSFWSIANSSFDGNFKPYPVSSPSATDANILFTNVSWSNDTLGYSPGAHGVMGYHLPVNMPYYPRVTTSASSYNLDIRTFRYVVADSSSADVTINLPAITLADEGIIITVFKYPNANNVIIDANTVGSSYIYTSGGGVTTRTISTRAGHLTITPLSTPGALYWLILSETL